MYKKAIKYIYDELNRVFVNAGLMNKATEELISMSKHFIDIASNQPMNYKVASESQYDKIVDSISKSLNGATPDEKMKVLESFSGDVNEWIAKMMATKYLYDIDSFKEEMPKAFGIYSGQVPDVPQGVEDKAIQDVKDDFIEDENDHSLNEYENVDLDTLVDDMNKKLGTDSSDKIDIKENKENKKKNNGIKTVKPRIDMFNTSLAAFHTGESSLSKTRRNLKDDYDLFPTNEDGLVDNEDYKPKDIVESEKNKMDNEDYDLL